MFCNQFEFMRTFIWRLLWQWDELPATVRPRYADMARLLASVGVNSIVLNNVNSCDSENKLLMSSNNLRKAGAP
jgi:alpha-glucuronidase